MTPNRILFVWIECVGGIVFSSWSAVTPGVRSGKPCVRGTRITVQDVLEYLAARMTEAQILADFPTLTSESIRAGWRLLPPVSVLPPDLSACASSSTRI
jgi:uncharacterized protein (DUF433 family)